MPTQSNGGPSLPWVPRGIFSPPPCQQQTSYLLTCPSLPISLMMTECTLPTRARLTFLCCPPMNARLTLYQTWPPTPSYLLSQSATQDAPSPPPKLAARLCTAAGQSFAPTSAPVQVYGWFPQLKTPHLLLPCLPPVQSPSSWPQTLMPLPWPPRMPNMFTNNCAHHRLSLSYLPLTKAPSCKPSQD